MKRAFITDMTLEGFKELMRREFNQKFPDEIRESSSQYWKNASLSELVNIFSNPENEQKTRKISFGLFCIRQNKGRSDPNLAQEICQIISDQKIKPGCLQLSQDGSFLRISVLSAQKPKVQFAIHKEWLEENTPVPDAIAHFIPFKHANEGRFYTIKLGDIQKIVRDEAWDKLIDPMLCQTWLRLGTVTKTKPSILIKSGLQKFGPRTDMEENSPALSSNKSAAFSDMVGLSHYVNPATNFDSSKASKGSMDFEQPINQTVDQFTRDRADSISKKKKITFALDFVQTDKTNGSKGQFSNKSQLHLFGSDEVIMVGHNKSGKDKSPHRGQRHIKTTIESGSHPTTEETLAEMIARNSNISEPLSRQSSAKIYPRCFSEDNPAEYSFSLQDREIFMSKDLAKSIEASTNPGSPAQTAHEIKIGEIAPRSILGKYSLSAHASRKAKS